MCAGQPLPSLHTVSATATALVGVQVDSTPSTVVPAQSQLPALFPHPLVSGGRGTAESPSCIGFFFRRHRGPRGGTAQIRGGAVALRLVPSLSASASSPRNVAAVHGEPKHATAWLPCPWFFPSGLSLPLPPSFRIPSHPIFDAWMAASIELEPHPDPHLLM